MTKATLYLLHYNNYYNRIVKKEDSLEAYLPYQLGDPIVGVNFIPNDYVDTTQIVNWEYDDPDYILVVDEENQIQSRWFVISTKRVRAGQIQLDLHRDLIADYKDEVIQAPCFIEKATPVLYDDPAIYNNEEMSFNQIKTSETLLKDRTGCPWVVGYIPRNSFSDNTPTTVRASAPLLNLPILSMTDLSKDELYQYSDKTGGYLKGADNDNDFSYIVHMGMSIPYVGASPFSARIDYQGNVVEEGSGNDLGASGSALIGPSPGGPQNASQAQQNVRSALANFTNSSIHNVMNSYAITLAQNNGITTQLFRDRRNQIIHTTSDDRYYRVNFRDLEGTTTTQTINITYGSNLYYQIYNNLSKNLPHVYSGTSGQKQQNWDYSTIRSGDNNKIFQLQVTVANVQVIYEPLSIEMTTSIAKDRYHLSDSPYDMFCIPYSDELQISYTDGSTKKTITTQSQAAIAMANAIPLSVGSGNQYDVQLLPFCPVPEYILANGTMDLGSAYKSLITDTASNSVVNIIFWCNTSQFDVTDVQYSIPQASNILDKKVQNLTDLYRICSPNYSGVFEFNPAKNNGVQNIIVNCGYKPYNPYIHVCINFNESGLYGNNFNDQRGLICGGDFSLPQVTDAWANYQMNNKTYQQMFDRQIQNMEVNNAVQRQKEKWSIGFGSVSGGISGAAAGGMMGGPWGAVAGGALGTITSLGGGLVDYNMSERLRNEALDYTKDMFGYNLQNIQALPQGLAKTTAFTPNNKIFPFIEYYTCTDTEKQALKDKLTYNGMTIMRIGNISSFLQDEPSYIKGRLIRLETVDEDYHVINGIANEIYKGVFI